MRVKHREAFVLIFALWVLSFLTILAVGVAAGIRQKVVLVQKLEQRNRMAHLIEAAVKYTAVYVNQQLTTSNQVYNFTIKENLHNNPTMFSHFDLGQDYASITDLSGQGEYYGVIDEERKLNINLTNVTILERLLERVLDVKPDEAQGLAQDIINWRHLGESEITGFFSDRYYENLQFPYSKKDEFYETMDELLLVRGVTKERYEKLINYLTVHGDGRININTASPQVLYALGLDDALIEKILATRRGVDNFEATADDHIFSKTFDIATEVGSLFKLSVTEARAIDSLNLQNLLSTNSYFFLIPVKAYLANSFFSKTVKVIFSSRENKIIYWSER